MKNTTKTLLAAATAALFATASAGAKGISSPLQTDAPDTFGSCYGGYSGGYNGGFRGIQRGGHYNSGYSGGYVSHATRTRCRVINRSYFWSRGCRYCRVTYLHERIDNCGRVVSCWRSCKTIRA